MHRVGKNKGSGSLLPGGWGGCTWGGRETRGVVVSRQGWGCTRGGQETRGVVVSYWGGVHTGWSRDKGSGSLSLGGVGKRQGQW